MKKVFIGCLLLTITCSSCTVQTQTIKKLSLISGSRLFSVQDSLSSLAIDGKKTYEYYENKLIDSSDYTIVNKSCDSSYNSPNINASYLVRHDGLCYEIIEITKDYMELVYTANGKTLTFRKRQKE